MWIIPATIFWICVFALSWLLALGAFGHGWIGIVIVIASIGITALLMKKLILELKNEIRSNVQISI